MAVGEAFGDAVGETVGETVGDTVGETVGDTVGETVGETVGDTVGETVGDTVGDAVGDTVGEAVGVGLCAPAISGTDRSRAAVAAKAAKERLKEKLCFIGCLGKRKKHIPNLAIRSGRVKSREQ